MIKKILNKFKVKNNGNDGNEEKTIVILDKEEDIRELEEKYHRILKELFKKYNSSNHPILIMVDFCETSLNHTINFFISPENNKSKKGKARLYSIKCLEVFGNSNQYNIMSVIANTGRKYKTEILPDSMSVERIRIAASYGIEEVVVLPGRKNLEKNGTKTRDILEFWDGEVRTEPGYED